MDQCTAKCCCGMTQVQNDEQRRYDGIQSGVAAVVSVYIPACDLHGSNNCFVCVCVCVGVFMLVWES